jgi:sulfonate transport system ATP-binding protein
MSQPTIAGNGLALRIAGLEKAFRGKAVLRGVTLDVRPSEFVAVVGKSGCGKSTLLRLIAGLDEASRGSVCMDGNRLSGVNPEVRMVFQDHRLLPWMRALGNVALGRGPEWMVEARAMLQHVGLGDRADDMPASLSGGEKQRVSLARALLSHPRLLLLDEPLGALDALTRIGMQALIERLWQEQGFTAVLITHDVDEALVLADRIVVLQDGVVDFEVDVELPRPRARTGPEFDRIKELVLGRILHGRDFQLHSPPRENPWHDQTKTDFTSEPSSPLDPAREPSARGAIPRPNSTDSSTQITINRSRVPWSGASST